MSRPKSAKNCSILPWLSAAPDGREKCFLQIGLTLLQNEKFNELSHATRNLFLCMAMEARGKREFTFPQAKAKEYGILPLTLRRGIEQLIENGIIELKSSGKITREANIYSFCINAFRNEK